MHNEQRSRNTATASVQAAAEAEGLCKGFLYKKARPKGSPVFSLFQLCQAFPASWWGKIPFTKKCNLLTSATDCAIKIKKYPWNITTEPFQICKLHAKKDIYFLFRKVRAGCNLDVNGRIWRGAPLSHSLDLPNSMTKPRCPHSSSHCSCKPITAQKYFPWTILRGHKPRTFYLWSEHNFQNSLNQEHAFWTQGQGKVQILLFFFVLILEGKKI